MDCVAELDVPSEFNEIEVQEDGDCVIRTLVQFCLRDEAGNMVSIEELGSEQSPSVILQGIVLEPLSAAVRDATVSMLCTSQLDQPHAEPESELIAEDANVDIQALDRASLSIGDIVDGYCNKTYKWYEAKIIDVASDVEKGDRLKIHFKGWSGKHDEWLSRNSERIAAAGSSAALMEAAKRKATCMVPWYDVEGVEKLTGGNVRSHYTGKDWERKQISVEVRGLQDYCIDYSYANPTLWLISTANIWYRIAGPICTGGRLGSPLPEYSVMFTPTVLRFACAAHVAMVLLDFLPSIPKMSLEMVASEVQARSSGQFDESVLLSNWQFLTDQLKGISPPAEWDCSVDISKSSFLSQLKKQGGAFVRGGGRVGITTALESKKKKSPGDPSLTLSSSNKKEKSKAPISQEDAEAAALKQALSKIKFPIEDLEYWKIVESIQSKQPQAFPVPLFSNLMLCPHRIMCPSASIGSLLQIWATLGNFQHMLGLPAIPLASLDALLLPGYGCYGSPAHPALNGDIAPAGTQQNFCSLPSNNIHPLLREINVALLSAILLDRQESGRLNDMKLNVSNYRTADDNNSEDDTNDDVTTCFLGWFPPGFCSSQNGSGVSSPDFESRLQRYLRYGDTWVELFRVFVACQHNFEMSEYFDPIAECEAIIKTLLRDADSNSFSKPVNPDKDGVPDYFLVVKHPMDLGTVTSRINSGWYDPIRQGDKRVAESFDDSHDRQLIACDDNSKMAHVPNFNNGSVQFSVGNRVDYYSELCQRWYEAEVVSVKDLDDAISVRIKNWPAGSEESVEMDSPRIAPLGSRSSKMVRVCRNRLTTFALMTAS
jgi:hypothetical protein